MARGKLEFLSKEEINRIHITSLRVLDEIGIALLSDSVRKLLEDYGAIRSKDGKRMLIPESVVKSAILSAPKSILFAARDKKYDFTTPSEDKLFVANGGEGIYVKNLLTGDSYPSTNDDLRDFTIFANELPQVDFIWGMVGALDQPLFLKELVEVKTCFEYTTKHVQSGPLTAEQARDMVALTSILTDGADELAKRPILSAVVCPISPLTFEKGLAEAQVELARASIPVVAMSASLAGITSPVTLSGTIVQVNAENLASLVITQAAKKGAPWIYSSDSSPADLQSGSIDYEAFEAPLLRTGAGQMGKHYGFSTMVSGASLENRSLSLRTVQDGLPHMIIESIIPSDLGTGMGGIDQAAGASFEQFLVDAWVWELAREFARTFESDESAISIETIREAASDGTYLNKKHTLSRYRKEFLSTTRPEVASKGEEKIEKKGAILRKAREEAEKLLKKPKTILVSKEESREMEKFIKNIASKLQ